MILYLFCFAGFFLYTEITSLEISQCKTGVIVPTSFGINDCEKSPCPFKKGTTKTITLEFTADDNYPDAIILFTATYLGQTKGYPGFDGKNGCNGIYSLPDNKQVGCPLEKGKMYKFELILPLKLPAPAVTVPAKLGLRSKASKKDIVCTETSISLKS